MTKIANSARSKKTTNINGKKTLTPNKALKKQKRQAAVKEILEKKKEAALTLKKA